MNDEQLTQRMQTASEAVQISDSAQARHLEAISAALESAATPDAAVVPLATASATRRRRIVASVVAAAVMAPAGLAAASDDSLPGDALYPVKQISERVLVLFDSDVIAEHRIEEIEALEGSGRADGQLYDDARAALAELGEGHPLWQRLAAATPPDDDGDDPEVSDDGDRPEIEMDVVVELALPDGSKAKITLAGDEIVDIDAPTGWSVSEMGDDDARLESDRYTVEIEVASDGSVELVVTERDADDNASEGATTSGTNGSDDDESSEAEITSTTTTTDREDDSDSSETASSDDDRKDDDASESP